MRADNFGSVMLEGGVCYQAMELQFHTPAEHTLNKKRYDMELQIIHKAITPGSLGKKIGSCSII